MITLEIAVLVAFFLAIFLLVDRWYKLPALLLAACISLMLLAMVVMPRALDFCLQIVHPISVAIGAVTDALGYHGSEQWSSGNRARDCIVYGALGYATMLYAVVLTRCFGIFDKRHWEK